MRRWIVNGLVTAIVCTSAGAEPPRVKQSDRRNRMFPELVVESEGRRATCDVLTFTGDGKHLLAVGDDKVVRVWEQRDGRFDSQSMKVLRWSAWGPQRGAIYALAVSPDPEGRRVAIGGVGMKTTAAAVLDRQTGEVLATIYAGDHKAAPQKGGFQSVRAITFSPGGERIAFGSADGSVWVWRPEAKGKEELKWLGIHPRRKQQLNRVRFLRFLEEDKLLSVAQNGEVCLWDPAVARQKPKQLPLLKDVAGPIHDVSLSRDGKWLAARAMNKPRIYVRSFDGKQRKDITLEDGSVASSLAFDGPERLAAAFRTPLENETGFYLESNDQVRLYDLSQEEAAVSEGPPHAGRVDILAFHPDGKRLAAAGGDDHEVTIWDLSQPRNEATELRGVGSGIWNVGFSKTGRYLAFQTQRDPEPGHPNRRGRGPWTLFDLHGMRWATTPAGFTPSPKLEMQDGWRVTPKPEDASTWYVEHRGQGRKHKLPWNKDVQNVPRCYTFLPRAEEQPVRLAVGHYYGVTVFEVTAAGVRRVWQGMGHEGEVTSLAVSPKGEWLVSASDDQTIAAWNLNDWPSGSALGARFRRGDRGQIQVSKVDLYGPAWEAGLVEGDRIVGLNIARELTFLRPNVKGSEKPVGSVEACLQALEAPEPGIALGFRLERGRNEWIDTLTTVQRRPLWRFFPTRNQEWVLWMGASPYYATSNNGDKYIGWQMNNSDDLRKTPRFYPAEQFREVFHQPAVIDKLLAERNILEALKESDVGLEPPNFNKLFDTVSVHIEAGEKQVKDAGVQVTLDIQSRNDNPDYAPMRAELWVNDHRVMVWPEKKGQPFPKKWPQRWIIKRNQLRAGHNDIVLQCYNRVDRRGEGRLEASTSVFCVRQVQKRNLHGLVVGINDYSRSVHNKEGKPCLHNLNTPFDDVKAVREAWMSQKDGKLYSQVDITLVGDKENTPDRQSILKAFRELAERVGPDDQVCVFLAGHGTVLDPEHRRNFAFCCPDFDPGKPETSINARELYEVLADIPCRKVVFLDVCHSGEVVQPMRDLTPGGRGPTIFAACDSGESSWEPRGARDTPATKGSGDSGDSSAKPQGAKVVKHSFFVTALLEAFEQGDQDRNGVLDDREIFTYTRHRLPKLLEEAQLDVAQTPTCFPRPLGRNVFLARGGLPRKPNK